MNKYMFIFISFSAAFLFFITPTFAQPTLPPLISLTSVTGNIISCLGTASASKQQFGVSGLNLTSNINITSSIGFEISLNSSNGFASSISLSPNSGVISSTIIYVRSSLNASQGNISEIVTVSSAGAISQNAVVNATVNALPTTPVISAGSVLTFCSGSNVVLTSNAATGNQWLLNGAVINAATNATYTVNATGNYTVQTTNSNNCTSLASAATVVTVNTIPTAPTITAGSSTTICSGAYVLLTSSSASGNQWLLNGTAIGGAINTIDTAKLAGNYTVTSTVNGCTSAASAATTVTVNTLPAIPTITNNGPLIFCDGDSTVLTSSATSGNQWVLNGVTISGSTSNSYTVKSSGNYTVSNTNSNGCFATSSAKVVTVNIATVPSITNSRPISFCSGDSTILTSSASTGNQWLLGGTAISGATSSNIIVKTAGNYTVTNTNSSGCSATSTVTTVAVNTIPSTPSITSKNATTFCQGLSDTLVSNAVAGNQWFLNGTAISGATATNFIATTAGNYTVTAANGNCISTASAAIGITVNPLPATPTITSKNATTFCQGLSDTLVSSASSGNQWLLNGAAINAATGPTFIANAAGNYTVTSTTSGCTSIASAATAIKVNPLPAKPTITRDVNNNLVSSSATGNQWFSGTSAIASATAQNYKPITDGNYTVQVTQNGCVSPTSDAYYYLVTAIINVNTNESVTIYPNPVKDILIINYKLINIHSVNAQLYNVNGIKLIDQKNVRTGSSINMSSFATGDYILNLENATTGKIIYSCHIIKLR